MLKAIIELAIAVVIIISIIAFVPKLWSAWVETHKVKCDNNAEWQSVKYALKEIEAGSNEVQIPFYNKGCHLVSFSPAYFGTGTYPPREIDRTKAALCLCKIKDKCESYECHQLEKFDQINDEQYTTKDFAPYMFITFTASDRKLIITDIKKTIETITRTYEFSDKFKVLDPTGLINKLELTFKLDYIIDGFLPIVDLIETPVLLSSALPVEKINGFPILFNVLLAKIPKEGTEELIAKPESAEEINPLTVKTAYIELLIDKNKIDSLPENLRDDLQLYHKQENIWLYSPLSCQLHSQQQEKYLCSTTIIGFPKEFAIAAKEFLRIWPLDNPIITSCYGQRTLWGKEDWHDGIDLKAEQTPFRAVANGKVEYACTKENCNIISDPNCKKECGGYGINIIILHEDGTRTRYSHLSETRVNEGDEIIQGQIIGVSGNTGYSEAPHLDFKVYYTQNTSPDVERPSYRRDPLNYLPKLEPYAFSQSALSCKESPTVLALSESSVKYIA